ncbi:hypothetical protein CVT24_000869 [Panaeolus cyanescens]|uniref:S1 motif domain-containing protein n=1 Tax=Panaeolus cyanescens TaxID=181874 RepID=A0A409YCB1_9AGAR|nr:hypothetical protein CVT24_000869 [Panaeolus cyanescens]
MNSDPTIFIPGQPITLPARSPVPELSTGVYQRDGQIRASLSGLPQVDGNKLRIPRLQPHPPSPGSIVLGFVTRLSPIQASLSINVVDGIPLPSGEEFQGMIRVQDVRATEKDKIKIGDCFRAGDVVRCQVISLGDARSYFVTTARNDLGVIFATSEAGGTLEPVSWQEMRCSMTGKIEKRKCAKPLYFPPNTDWKEKYNEVLDMLSETRQELDDFHQASKELEAELESELARTEKSQKDLMMKVSRAETERDDWKGKFMSLQTTHNTTTTSLQRELDQLRQEYQKTKVYLRELEMGNDDLERNERAVSSSLADLEAKYSRVLEEKILLEHELLEKATLEEQMQRLKDELRDANVEISIFKDQLDALKALKSDSSSVKSSTDDLLTTAPLPGLDLEDISPASESGGSEISPPSALSTPKASLSRSTVASSFLPRTFAQDRPSPLTALRTSSVIRSTTLPSLASPSTSSPRGLMRPTAIKSASTIATSTTSASASLSKNKGVQMVSEMRARVKNLEQKIHTRVPRLRMGSMVNRQTSVSGVAPSTPITSSSSSAASNASTAKTSLESQRKSMESRLSADSGSDKNFKRDDSSGWVLIMEDSPSPQKEAKRLKEKRRLSNSTAAPTSYRSTMSSTTRDTSPTLRSTPANPLAASTGSTLRRPHSRLSGGGASSSTSTSRPQTPTFLPIPSSSSYTPSASVGLKRSMGPSSSTQMKRSSLGKSHAVPVPPLPQTYRERPLTMPPLTNTTNSKALPTVPSDTHPNVTLRSKMSASSSTSTILSKSRIGRPSGGGISGRRSAGVEPSGALDLSDLQP